MKQYLLIDIGGTFIKYSLADEQARKISGGKVPTPLTNMDDLLAVIEGFAAPLQGQFVGCANSPNVWPKSSWEGDRAPIEGTAGKRASHPYFFNSY